MKKIVLGMFLLMGVLSFSRYVEECEVVSNSVCISLQTGKSFHFRNYPFYDYQKYEVHRVYFEGNGYHNLRFMYSDYLYN